MMLRHEPNLGCTTAFAYTVSRSHILYDPEGAFAALQAECRKPYPEALQRAIVRYNHPLLRGTISSYYAQLKKAVGRADSVSINHRLAALLASCFDIIFAVNRRLHPREKRLLQLSLATCKTLPSGFEADIRDLLVAAGKDVVLLEHLERLLDALDAWPAREGFMLGRSGETA